MAMVSVIIPARKEKYLGLTLEDLYEKRGGQIEVFVVLDGWEPEYELVEYPRMTIFRHAKPFGMRNCINEAAKVARGKYLMKLDAHCQVGENWDKILSAECEDNWIVVPRRYWLDAPKWTLQVDKHGNIGYVDMNRYLWPFKNVYRPRLTCRPWPERADAQAREDLSEDMGFQGSMWFMHREHYTKRIGYMSSYGYGTFAEEPQELGLKTQLGPWGGKVMRNKRTWYAHWSKPSEHWRTPPDEAGRVSDAEREAGYLYSFDYWWNNRWPEATRTFQDLIEQFWPVHDWQEHWRTLVPRFDRYNIREIVDRELTMANADIVDGQPWVDRAARRAKAMS